MIGRPLPFLLLLAALVACSEPPEPEPAATVTDDTGRTIPYVEQPVRVISLAPSVTELAFAAGLGDRLVAVTTADNYPPEVADIARISALPLNHEEVVALRPDLVLASDQVNDPRDAEALAEVGIPTYYVSVQTLPGVSRAVRAMGTLFGDSTAAAVYADSLEAGLRALDRGRTESPERPGVIFLIGDETLYSFGPESYVHSMIETAGGRSLTARMDTEAPILSEEFVLSAAPDVILTAFEGDAAHLARLHPSWASVPAIAGGRVHRIDADLVLRPGPRLIAGTHAIQEALKGSR